MTEEILTDDYETFSDSDFCKTEDADDAKTERKKKFRLNRNTLSIVMMAFVIVFSVANLVLGIINYKRYDEIQIGAQFYFQNGAENQNTVNGDIGTDMFVVTYETTTVLHVEIQTEAPVTQNPQPPVATVSPEPVADDTVKVSTTAEATVVQNVSGVVNINTATAEELTVLDGIGDKKAQAIVEYRNENGYFTSVEELTNVSGIGEKTLAKNIDRITVG